MWFSTRRARHVGLDVGTDAARVVSLGRSRNGWSLLGATEGSLSRPPAGFGDADDSIVTSTVASELLNRLKIGRTPIISVLPSSEVVIKRLTVPTASRKALDAAVRSEIESNAPFQGDDFDLAWALVAPRKSLPQEAGVEVLAAAVRSGAIEDAAAIVAQAGYRLSGLDAEPLALANAFAWNYPEIEDKTLLLNVNRTWATVCCMNRGELVWAAGTALSNANAESILSIVAGFVDRMAPSRAATFSQVMLSGEACQTPGLVERMALNFRAPSALFDPVRRIARQSANANAELVGPAFAVAVGSALGSTSNRGRIDLRACAPGYRAATRVRRLVATISAVLLFTTSTSIAALWFHLGQEHVSLSTELHALDAHAGAVDGDVSDIRTRHAAALRRALVAFDLERDAAATIDLLAVVSRSIPDGLWLADFKYQGGSVDIEGRARTVAAVTHFAETLDASGTFRGGVRIASTNADVERDPLFRFRIAAAVK